MSKAESALKSHAKGRTGAVVSKIRAAMVAIELDIETNECIYPFNKGRVTKAEVCRRANVRDISLHGKAHRDTTLTMVNTWVTDIKSKLITGRRAVRSTVTKRADDWKNRYEETANWVHRYHVEDAHRREELKKAKARIVELKDEVDQLREQLTKGKVVPLKPPSRRGS